MNSFNYERHILALNDTDLEKLVRRWADSQSSKYISTMRFAGAGDLGRDVVGFCSKLKHEGEWDNYQCKQYGSTLPTQTGMNEIGKILYFAFDGHFTSPLGYYFVAPKGVNRNLRKWMFQPEEFKRKLIENWDKYCKKDIISGQSIELTPQLHNFISKYDFSNVHLIDLDYIVNDAVFRSVLVEEFGGELLSAPASSVPTEIKESESIYIEKILDAYSDYDSITYQSHCDIIGHNEFEEDFLDQRERFYSAEAFKTFYRDNTLEGVLKGFEKEILNGVKPLTKLKHEDAFQCMCSTLSQAASIQPSGKLAINARIDIKQGYCHHFSNENKISWRRK